ncbi:MAG: ester cyclase [Chloroflexi bacterium]|nr:MAG: ester cyclase [Chloroflexota bacterium]
MTSNVERTMQAMDAWNRQDLDEYCTIYHPDAVLHGFAPVPLDVAAVLEGYRAFFAGFPDIRFDLLDSVSDGETVAMRVRLQGTHTGTFQGIPATGRPIGVEAITIMRVREGKIIERWNQFDQMSLMQQLGVIPTSPA